MQFKKVIDIYSEFPRKSKSISQNIFSNTEKLEKAKSIIVSNSQKNRNSSINLLR